MLNDKRKTINGEDILYGMSALGFDNYAEACKVYLSKYRSVSRSSISSSTIPYSLHSLFLSSSLLFTPRNLMALADPFSLCPAAPTQPRTHLTPYLPRPNITSSITRYHRVQRRRRGRRGGRRASRERCDEGQTDGGTGDGIGCGGKGRQGEEACAG